MIRLRRALEIFQVATDASRIRAGEVVIVIHVALHALHRRMRARQREAGRCVVKTRACPSGGVVALRTGL